MAGPSFQIIGADKLTAELKGLALTGTRKRTVLKQIGGVLKMQVAKNFQLHRDPITGSPWKRTTDFTLSVRPGGGEGGKTMLSTSRLLNSLVSTIPKVVGDTVSLTTNVIYANINNSGGIIRAKVGKKLAIPLTPAAARAGGARVWWQKHLSERPFFYRAPGARDDIAATTYIATSVVTGRGKKKTLKIIYHFVLVDKVTIPARRFLGFGAEYIAEINKAAGDFLFRLDNKPGASGAGGTP